MFTKVLIANRGVIARRIERTLRKMGIASIAVYSKADAGSRHVSQADIAVEIGAGPAIESYLNVERILETARETGAEAIHPGYGFLSENAEFAEACESAGLVFLGPTPDQIRAFGLKNTARELAVASGLPILPGTHLLTDVEQAIREAERIGFPVMLKSAGGGGGIGMRRCNSSDELLDGFEAVSRLSETHFKGSGIFLEKFVARARHVELQVFGDGAGQVVSLGERDCSVQRRNQKVVEETPAPGLRTETRERLHRVARTLMQSILYRSAGTVEFLYDSDSEEFYFLEVNSRLQVEHGVTEEVWSVDLVEWMVRLGSGDMPNLGSIHLRPEGASVQVRLYAENPLENFGPSSGVISRFAAPENTRCETWIEDGTQVTPYYDPLLAKIITRGRDRKEALANLKTALTQTKLYGLETNLEFLQSIVEHPDFVAGGVTTAFLNGLKYLPYKVKVMEPGMITTVQSYPGRLGYWDVGVPPSGPMDSLSFRLANSILGNTEHSAALECTVTGPTLQFLAPTRIAITGADMQTHINGERVPLWTATSISAGDILSMSTVDGSGARTYIAVDGGFDVPEYLGSATTFTLGKFGGHAGRAVVAGDYLTVRPASDTTEPRSLLKPPRFEKEWTIGVMYGPQGSPDFLTAEYIETFFAASWRVHHNSSRTGVRLIGPKPGWVREDGGDAGLHPSNLHDNAYAVGAIDFTGDMPVILGPDGPSLGGFVCPAVIVDAELWKVGQLSPEDSVRFVRVSEEQALEQSAAVKTYITALEGELQLIPHGDGEPAVLKSGSAVTVRASGDRYLLIEFGEPILDLDLRFRAYAFMQTLQNARIEGILDLTPGIRSLQIHYDTSVVTREKLLALTDAMAEEYEQIEDLSIPSRIVHLPLSWDDPATRLAIERYMSSVRADAPWCPSNLEFIRRINGLRSIEDVHKTVFDATYFVLGLGDVYLGAPVATPIDPRHRLVTTKYNPARTWTPENAVGIGGAYLCVYGMEGPGGYQFVGRTLQMWNTYRTTSCFETGKPWLLRFFDQIRFHPVGADELLDIRERFPIGRYPIKIEETQFELAGYHRFLKTIETETRGFRAQQQQAFGEERRHWAERGEFQAVPEKDVALPVGGEFSLPAGCAVLRSPTTASVWRSHAAVGDLMKEGERLFVLEAMKMEIAVHASQAGEIVEILCQPGSLVMSGQPLLVYRPSL